MILVACLFSSAPIVSQTDSTRAISEHIHVYPTSDPEISIIEVNGRQFICYSMRGQSQLWSQYLDCDDLLRERDRLSEEVDALKALLGEVQASYELRLSRFKTQDAIIEAKIRELEIVEELLETEREKHKTLKRKAFWSKVTNTVEKVGYAVGGAIVGAGVILLSQR